MKQSMGYKFVSNIDPQRAVSGIRVPEQYVTIGTLSSSVVFAVIDIDPVRAISGIRVQNYEAVHGL